MNNIEAFDIINKNFPQNCGDSLFVIEKTNIKKQNYLYRCQFQKYPYEVLEIKDHILRGVVNNPQIEQVEFIDKIWPQNCGDSLRIIEKTNIKKNNNFLWKCEFIKYPFQVLVVKYAIKKGTVLNPQIEIEEFVNKIWPQNCGDSLKIIPNSKQKIGNRYFWKCIFLKYNNEIFAEKDKIKEGKVVNTFLPSINKENLIKYIQENFKEKPTLQKLANSLKISIQNLSIKINSFELRNLIKYYPSSKEEIKIKDFIESLDIKNIEFNTSELLKKREIDILISNLKLGFEYNGNYWHSNECKENNYHQEKSLLAQEKGYFIVNIWEWEWEYYQEKIKYLIKSKLGIFEKKVFARKCQIKELDYKEYADFCNKNHLQGECGAKVKLGLSYKDELIQVMSFGSPRFTSDYEYEIIRECSKLGYIIIGGKERLWKYFIKNFSPKNCISYCDFSKFTGESYLKLGFKKERLNKPGFWWWKKGSLEVFWRNPKMHSYYLKNNYLRLYDCGQLVFIWNKNNN